jgi:hypothetical protein
MFPPPPYNKIGLYTVYYTTVILPYTTLPFSPLALKYEGARFITGLPRFLFPLFSTCFCGLGGAKGLHPILGITSFVPTRYKVSYTVRSLARGIFSSQKSAIIHYTTTFPLALAQQRGYNVLDKEKKQLNRRPGSRAGLPTTESSPPATGIPAEARPRNEAARENTGKPR